MKPRRNVPAGQITSEGGSGIPATGVWAAISAALLTVGVAAFVLVQAGYPDSATLRRVTVLGFAVLLMLCTALGLLAHSRAIRLAAAERALKEGRVRLDEVGLLLEHTRAAAELANRTKSAFLANIGQELRTPLHTIIDYSSMAVELLDGDEDAVELAADLERIGGAGRHLLGVIDGVLDVSRADAGGLRLMVESFDVAAVVREAADLSQSAIAASGNLFELNCPDDLGLARSDPAKVRQILLNLLGNAARFTDGGQVTLTASRDGGWLLIEVRDSGGGMTEEQVKRFTQPAAVLDSGGAPAGLGLALTMRLCALLGGGIEVQSALGSGSVFIVRLPTSMPDALASGIFFAPAVKLRTAEHRM